MSEEKCPRCNEATEKLIELDVNIKSRLMNQSGQIFENVCERCFAEIARSTKAGDPRRKGRPSEAQKEQHRLQLWRSRVQLIREAKDKFANQDFSGAMVAYEKYFRILEIIYDTKMAEITAEQFNNAGRAKEMVVMVSAFWDMVRIFDQAGKHKDRLNKYALKLGEFLPNTPMWQETLIKIKAYRSNNAKNKDIIDLIIKTAKKKKRRCFIASSAFEGNSDITVRLLTQYRDQVLEESAGGKAFIHFYYLFSPQVASLLDKSPLLRAVARRQLSPLAHFLKKKYNLKAKSTGNTVNSWLN